MNQKRKLLNVQTPKSKTIVVNFRMNIDEVKELKKFFKLHNLDMAEFMRAYLRNFLKEKQCPTCNREVQK